MDNNIGKRGRLEEEVFSYRSTKDQKVILYWQGRQVMILQGKDSEKFLQRIATANDSKEEQLIMAKVTGNFKRGNEKQAKRR
ncbi:hypothetical protein [Paenibacillus medicaginis]|uniref:Uncharacterized protein n=1 Tax=Paenibacillus medicaginis TaxID=1470560 RepID=A0ABV5C2L0_9BACL